MATKLITGIIFFWLSLLFIAEHMQCDDSIGISTIISPVIEKNEELSNAVNNLGYNLITKLIKDKKDDNVIISPTGIAGVLAMALLGSVGKSYDELANILGFSQDIRVNRANHELLGGLIKNLNENKTTASRTMFADAVFVDNATKLRQEYRSYLERVYNGEAWDVNFADGKSVKALINEWASNKTSGKIQDFLKEPLPLDTQVVLLSALYFSGQWKQPFIPEYTMKMPFKTPTREISTDLMMNLGYFDYIYSVEHDLQMIALPYNDSVTKMYVIKPRKPENLTLVQLMNQLNYTTINNLIKTLTNSECVVRFPKMDLQYTANLVEPLELIGLHSIFQAGQANFALMIDNKNINETEDEMLTRINKGEPLEIKNLREIVDALPNPGLHVDKILHDVKITIDEFGTEAAAVTGAFLARSADLFYADSPFYMFIRNEKTKLVTFSAAIFDPTS